jgi:hypothetical protein
MRTELRNLGFNVWSSQTPIIPVVVGEMYNCFRFWKDLFEEGVYVNAVVPPAVPRGQSLVRTSYMATHTDEHLDKIWSAFKNGGYQAWNYRSQRPLTDRRRKSEPVKEKSNANTVTIITDEDEKEQFIQFPYTHYEEDEYWVAPLLMEQKKLLE